MVRESQTKSCQTRSGKAVSALCGMSAAVALLAVSGPSQAYTEKTLYTFCSANRCADGSNPGGVVIDPSGNLFGVTYRYGQYGAGTVFEFLPATSQYIVLHNFCENFGCPDGSGPGLVNLVIDVNGNLYGTTTKGGHGKHAGNGEVFELVKSDSGWHEQTLFSFCGEGKCGSIGAVPQAGLTYAGQASGQLYDGTSPLFGTTQYGGTYTAGTVFSLTPVVGSKRWSEQVLYSFCAQTNCVDGAQPESPLYVDSQGNIYGTTQFYGQDARGTVFELSPSGSGYTQSVLYSFCQQVNCPDGEEPYGGVIMDLSGNLEGTTGAGGSNADGVLFRLSPNSGTWQYSVLDNFDGSNGRGPTGLTIDGAGNVFGTTASGGTNDKGTVFEYNGSIQTLYSFCPESGCADGKEPLTGVVEDKAGNLYGVTGERNRGGTLYELSP
jgi:uncharacterized repeat protein (TIGR03803 family)